MIVRFGATQTVTALLTITLPDGSYPAPGSNVTVDGGGVFVLGFDGQAYLTDLSASNRAVVSWLDGECVIDFSTAVETGQIQTIPVTCK